MENNQNHNPNSRRNKDKLLVLDHIKNEIEKGSGLTIKELSAKYGEEQLFYTSLKYVTTTKKALCVAIDIPVEAACRYKKHLEDRGLLVESIEVVICPYTKHYARLISTNPEEFDRLSETTQLNLF
ncbi:hypothetical protein [Aquimarina celericrescens]|uniref:Uncharacterized protein n=1 Tax=Aquimarina celericrescens TaxID=1964542 RepID=A0ABW5AUP1_9FLAO|nr:hypothetical protein [Aquimarina celericrescens]